MTPRTVRQAGDSSGLSRESTLRAALEIIDADGIEGLSMRRLGRALDRDPMALYRHAATKPELLDGVAEAVLADLSVDTSDEDWAAQLRTVARQFRTLTLGLHRLPIREFPRLRSLAPVLAAYDGAAELEQGMDILLTGLRAQLHPTNPPQA